MTGDEFQKRIEASEYSQRELAARWGVSHTTIQRECRRDEVRGLYHDAILYLLDDSDENGTGPGSPVAESCAAPQVAVSPAGTLHVKKQCKRDDIDTRTLCGKEVSDEWLTCLTLTDAEFPERGIGGGRPICGVCSHNQR